MNQRKAAWLVMMALMVFAGTRAGAATLTVANLTSAPCTGAFPTISAAVAAASPGDTIKVCPGTYDELVTVNKTLTINGAQSGVDARAASRTGLPATESVVDGALGTTSFYVTANNVTIDGFTVQGNTNGNVFGAGIVLGAGTSGAHVLNNIVQNNIVGLFLANSPGGNQAVIQRNVFRNNNNPGPATGTGIYSDQFVAGGLLSNALIDSNNFTGNSDAGIDFSSTQSGSQSQITTSNNTFDGNGRAFFLLNVTSSSIVSNSLKNATGADTADIRIFGGVTGLSIQCNILQNGAGRAIRINDGNGPPANPNSNITLNFNNISGYPIGLVVDAGSYTGGPGSLNAKNDWWGSATGPTIASNPGGTGESIVDPDGVVNYQPFRITPQGIPCPTPPFTNEEQCERAVRQEEKAFAAQQEADEEAFESQHHTKKEREAFEEQQEASRKAFEKRVRAEQRQCEQLPGGDRDDKDHRDDRKDK